MDLTTIIIAVTSSSVLVEVVRWIKESVSKKEDKLDVLRCAICEMIYDRVLHLCTKYIDAGTVPYLQLRSMLRLYSRYIDLRCCDDDEDSLEVMVNIVKELPVK